MSNETAARRVASESAQLQPLDWLLLIIPGTVWGSSFYLIAIGLESFAPGLITPMRVIFGCLTLSFIPKARVKVPRAAWRNIALLGVVWLAAPLTFFPFAEQHVSSSVTGMLNGATPLFVAMVASVIARRLPARGQMLGIAIGFFGVVLIALPTVSEGSSSSFGVALIVIALVLYGFALNIASPLQQKYGALPVLWRAEIVAVIVLLPLGIFSLINNDRPFLWGPFAAMIALGVLGTALAHYAMVMLAGRIGSTRAAASLYLMPAVSLALGVFLNNEDVAPLAIVGSVTAVGGAWVLSRSRARSVCTMSADKPSTDAPFDPAAVPIRAAATVMLVRDHPINGLEVFMLQRTLAAVFAKGMYVFPGGRVDANDNEEQLEAICDGLDDEEASALLGIPNGGLSYWVAAIRECFEEAGVLLARPTNSNELVRFDTDSVLQNRFNVARHAIHDSNMSLVELCATENLRLVTNNIHYVSHWITPLGEPRRFDTRFFIARAPEAQEPLHDNSETIASLWVSPNEALERHARGDLAMIPPTTSNLQFLAPHSTTTDALNAAKKIGTPTAILPKLKTDAVGKVIGIAMPGDADYN